MADMDSTDAAASGTLLDGPRWGPAEAGPARRLVAICHGVGASGEDLIALAPALGRDVPDALFIAPDGPEPYDWAASGRQWFSLRDRRPDLLEAGVRIAARALDAFLDKELARSGLPPTEYALAGFSQGAMTALFAGLRRRHPPRAIIACSGALLAHGTLAREMTHRPPVLLVHGEADEVVPAAWGRATERALRGAGVPVESLFIPGLGHGIDATALEAAGAFLRRAFAPAHARDRDRDRGMTGP